MRLRNISVLLLSAALFAVAPDSVSAASSGKTWRRALELYRNCHYEAARELFSTMKGDATAEGYTTLCALYLRTEDSAELLASYRKSHPSGSLLDEVLLANATNLFDDGKYDEARAEYLLVNSASVPKRAAEYWFRLGYTQYSAGLFPEAMSSFERLEALPVSDYTAGGLYLHGVILYNQRRFTEALPKFTGSSPDPRFSELSEFYLIDCQFNLKNYAYVLDKGVKMYPDAPKERKEHLARMISESYLVTGDKEKAREYFEGASHSGLTRSDIFYSGSVLYAVEDYKGAIEQFNKLTDRSDSLGQIANYHLANSYLRTRNKVAAMEAFEDAASASFDPQIEEDASFNHAKLAFDLNKDTKPFASYLKRWSTRTRGEEMIYSYMALASLVDRDYAGAVAAYDNIDELTPDMKSNYTRANFLRAAQLMNNGSWSDAVTYLRTCGYYLPKNDRFGQLSRYWLAEAYYRTGNFKEAERLFLELYNSDALYDRPEGEALPYNVAYTCLKQENFPNAAKWFDVYISSPDSTFREDAFRRRADCDYLAGSYKEAVSSYQRVIDEYPPVDDLYAVYRKAMSQGLSKDRKGKVATLAAVENADTSARMYSECLYELGNTRMELKSYSKAVESFLRMKETAPDNIRLAKALLGLGAARKALGETTSALESYKEVVSLLPGSDYASDAMKSIEAIYKSRRQTDKFEEYVRQNSIASADDAAGRDTAFFNTAEQVFLTGDWQPAVQTLQHYLDSFPSGTRRLQARYYLAEAWKSLGDKEKALEQYRMVAESGAGNKLAESARTNCAVMLYDFERYSESYKAWSALSAVASDGTVRNQARAGMLRSAYRGKDYDAAISAADALLGVGNIGADLRREARFIKAKSLFSTSRRDEAVSLFKSLGAYPSTAEGAESAYMVMSDSFDRGDFETVEKAVKDMSSKDNADQYWLARAYLLLADSFMERGMYKEAAGTIGSVADNYEAEEADDDIQELVAAKLSRLSELKK